MPTDVKLAQHGMGMTEGTVIAWHKAVGDAVTEGELLLEIEAAKATVEIAAPASGKLASILVGADETVPVYTLLGVIE